MLGGEFQHSTSNANTPKTKKAPRIFSQTWRVEVIQAAIGALILLGIYKFINSKSEYEITWWMAFVFIMVPGFLFLLLGIGINLLNLSPMLSLIGYIFYFAVPFLILRYGLEFQRSPAIKYSTVVPVVAILTEIPFILIFGPGDI